MEDIKFHIKESRRAPTRINTQKFTPRDITVTLLNSKVRQKARKQPDKNDTLH